VAQQARQVSAAADNVYLPRLARIVDIRPETPTEKTFVLELDEGPPFDYQPGQFVLVSVLGAGEIPLGLASSPTRPPQLWITCRRYPEGQVTRPLHEKRVGDYIGLRGPLGNAFPLREHRGENLMIIGGGVGLPTLRSALIYALDNRSDFGELMLLYGARTPADRLYKDDLETWSTSNELRCLQTVDVGDEQWPHKVGFVTELIGECDVDPARTLVLMCGPTPMLQPAIKRLIEKGMDPERILINMEAHMKCGVGKCGHCALGDKYVCTDGPVFSYTEVQRLREP
jgi:sulfhydrogenase subunit gamma (sulfur reductase)